MAGLSLACHNILGQVEKQAKRFFVEVPGFSKNMDWALNLDFISKQAAQKLKKGEFKNFQEYLHYFGERYQQFYRSDSFAKKTLNSEKLGPDIIVDFGNLRTKAKPVKKDYWNFDEGRYVEYAKRAKNLKVKPKQSEIEYFGKELVGEIVNVGNGYNRVVKYNRKTVFELNKYGSNAVCFNHTADYSDFKQEFSNLFNKIQKMNSYNDVIDSVAELHWLMSCVMPFSRGSAGIADGMVKSLLESKGIRVSGWKKGIMPDCEAKITPLKEYIQKALD